MIATTWGGKGVLISEVERMVLGKCVLFIEVSSVSVVSLQKRPTNALYTVHRNSYRAI